MCESLLKRGFFDDCSDLVFFVVFQNHELRDVASQISCCAGAFAAETIQHSSESHHSAKLPIGFKMCESFELVIEQLKYPRQ